MFCYCTTDKLIENGISITSDLYLYPWNCPDEVAEKGKTLINANSIKAVDFWECEPRSDAGIYDKKTSCVTLSISFENLVFNGEKFVGVYMNSLNKILYFGGESITIINNSKFVGGWGDITEGVEYYLVNNK